MKIRIVCTIGCLAIFHTSLLGTSIAAQDPRVRTFDFTYIAQVNDIPKDAKKVSIWLPYPTSDKNQEITPLHISAPYSTNIYKECEYGNSILYLSAVNPKHRLIKIKMEFRVKRREYVHRDFERIRSRNSNDADPMLKRWLEPDRLVPIDERIKKLAQEITRGKTTDLEKVRAIYDYIVANLTYDKSGTGWGRGDISYACDVKRGNCTDFHSVFIGFCRANSIPAKFAIGFSLPAEHGQYEIAGYHCWAEFYLKGYGWVPVDASEANKNLAKRDYFFGAHDENRVQLTVGRDIILNPPQAGEPLNYFIYPYAEVDGKPFSNVQKKFIVKDLVSY